MDDFRVLIGFLLIALLFVFLGGMIAVANIDHNVPVNLTDFAIEKCYPNGGLEWLSVDLSEYDIRCKDGAIYEGELAELEN